MAHDFNDLLTTILGNAQLALMSVPADSELADDLKQICDAATRGAALTHQVLTFARASRSSRRASSMWGS